MVKQLYTIIINCISYNSVAVITTTTLSRTTVVQASTSAYKSIPIIRLDVLSENMYTSCSYWWHTAWTANRGR